MPTSMATALLSRFNYIFNGFFALCWGSLSRQQVHPSSPVLLTRTSPLGLFNYIRLHVLDGSCRFRVWECADTVFAPGHLIIIFTRQI